jgi:hypothetical protein
MTADRITLFLIIIVCFLTVSTGCSLGDNTGGPQIYPRIESEAIIIDHTCTDVSLIPDEYITQAKIYILQVVGESHSSQVRHGLQLLEDSDPKFDFHYVGKLILPAAETGMYLFTNQRNQYNSGWNDIPYIGEEEYWAMESSRKMTEATARYVDDQGALLKASLWLWCSTDIMKDDGCTNESGTKITFNDERLGAYLAAINRFNTKYPDTQFIYATFVTDDPNGTYIDDRGWRVTRYNDEIREDIQEHGGILFDQADIENWNITNTEQRIDIWEGHELRLRHPDYDEGNGPDTQGSDHTIDALCLKKAQAFWWMMAVLAGWDGTPE